MKKISSLFLACSIVFSSASFADDRFYKSVWQIVALLAIYTTYTLHSENQDLKAKLEKLQQDQQTNKQVSQVCSYPSTSSGRTDLK